jgi:hypothetical protein
MRDVGHPPPLSRPENSMGWSEDGARMDTCWGTGDLSVTPHGSHLQRGGNFLEQVKAMGQKAAWNGHDEA